MRCCGIRSLSMLPPTLRSAYRYVNGIQNLSYFSFDDVTNCSTFIKVNMKKSSTGKNNLSESVIIPYKGLFIIDERWRQIKLVQILNH